MSIMLQINALYSVQSEPWITVAANQPAASDADAITPDNFLEAEEDEVFAFEDRNSFAQPWRSVFIVLGDGCVYVFDSDGQRINEPSEGVVDGVQMLDGRVCGMHCQATDKMRCEMATAPKGWCRA